MKFIELSHTLYNGVVTYPGDPPTEIGFYMTYEECGAKYGMENAAVLDKISMVNTSGTYVDAPIHRMQNDKYVCHIPLEKLVDLEYDVVVQKPGKREFDLEDVKGLGKHGGAVLLCTGMSELFNKPGYGDNAGYLSTEAAEYLMNRGVALVGIDTPLIDKIEGPGRPVHDIILGAGSVVCENMNNLRSVAGLAEDEKGLLSVIPARVLMASFTARAFVKIPDPDTTIRGWAVEE